MTGGPKDIHAYLAEFEDIPGTRVFTAKRARVGYHMNQFAMSLMKAENRERFKADERVPGALTVYEKFSGYVPRGDGSATFTAGPKNVHFDRIEWRIIPDPSTAASALSTGEVD